MQQPPSVRMCQIVVSLLTWFALGAQLFIIIRHRVMPLPDTLIQYFSYFTILTNSAVAIWFTSLLLRPGSSWQQYFSRATVATAITVYITMVGLVYNIILRFTWTPRGWQIPVDELLHSVIPVLVILYWLLFVPKGELKWAKAFSWLLYPFLYCIYILTRGSISGIYPYPFVDVNELGYGKVIFHCAVLCAAFYVVSLLFVGIDGRMGRRLKRRR